LLGGVCTVSDLWSGLSVAVIKTRRWLEWNACEEKPRSIRATLRAEYDDQRSMIEH
jgi:hypothetical protein